MIKGPKISPSIPKKNNPPTMEVKSIPVFMFVLLETIIGLNMLSTFEEMRPKMIIPHAEKKLPVENR